MRALALPLVNRHLGIRRPPPVAALQCRQPAHPLVPVSGWLCFCALDDPTLRNARLAGLGLDSPSQTAISGYAVLLQSLRSDVVGPHTHSCRFLAGVGLQVVCVPSSFGLTTCIGIQNICVRTSHSQHRWWVRRPTTSERSDWRRAACPPAGWVQQKVRGQMGRHQKSAQKNWNLTPINDPN